MAKSAKVKATLVDAVDVKAVWEMVPNFVMGDVSLKEFTAICDAADSLDKEYAKKDVSLYLCTNSAAPRMSLGRVSSTICVSDPMRNSANETGPLGSSETKYITSPTTAPVVMS